jgi:hypothetical protein
MRTFPGGVGPGTGTEPPDAVPGVPEFDSAPVIETSRPDSDEGTVEAALAASTRAEATLSALYRAIQTVTAGVSGAREANDQLATELQRVREMLGSSNEQRLALKNQVELVEHQLRESEREREFLVEEQDRFLTGLLEENEQTVERLVREREEAYSRLEQLMRQLQETSPPKRRTNPGLGMGDATPLAPSVRPSDPGAPPNVDYQKLVAERDRARGVLRRLQQQRDEAQQALAKISEERDQLAAELAKVAPSRVASPPRPFSPQDGRRTQPAIPLAVNRVTDPSPPTDDDLGRPLADRLTAPGGPPEELAAAILASKPSPPKGTPAQAAPTDPPKTPLRSGTPPPKPQLKQKPDPTTRPLGGYSMSGDDLGPERFESTVPPRPTRR